MSTYSVATFCAEAAIDVVCSSGIFKQYDKVFTYWPPSDGKRKARKCAVPDPSKVVMPRMSCDVFDRYYILTHTH